MCWMDRVLYNLSTTGIGRKRNFKRRDSTLSSNTNEGLYLITMLASYLHNSQTVKKENEQKKGPITVSFELEEKGHMGNLHTHPFTERGPPLERRVMDKEGGAR